ncbi:unnamed protein product [Cyprideis torosa]|uniref:Uncharacterized protein n=1 Tax=Cyprideis torosa TaxID=163714 RepID=A0A7R8ZTP5_9CRUS|nr:unnamed protein product [Cyprideis torosa]CAG0904515.1 unnamed protein product [Cyprideis torosa]
MVRDTSKSSITERPPTPPPQRASPLSTPKKRKLTPMPAATSDPPFVATKRSGLRKRTPPSRPELNRQKSFTFTPGMVDPSSVKSLSRSIQSIQSSAASAISSSIHSSVKDINFSPSATFLSHSIRHLSENRQNYFAGRRKSLSMYSLPQMGKSKKTSTTDRAPRSPTGSDVIPELPRCRSATFSAGCKIEDLVSARTRKGSVDSSSLEIKKSIKRRGVEFGPSEVETIESIPLEETRKTSNEGVPGFFYYSPAYLKRRFTVIAEADESEEKAEAAPQPPTNSTISILRRYSREAMSLLSVPLHRGSAQAHDEEKALEDIPAHDPSRRYSRLTKILEMASRFRAEEGIEEEDEKKPGILDKISQAIDDVPQFTGVQGAFQASLIRDPRFWCFNFAGLVGIMGTLTLYVLYKDFAISKNLEERFVYVLSAIGLGDLLGRLFAVMFVSWTFFNPLFVYALIQCLTGAIVLYHVSVETIEQLVVCCLGLGLCYGMQNVLLAVAPGKVYGPTNLTTTFGYILFWCGIGAFLGPPIAGALVDESAANGYTYAFVFIGTASMLGCLDLGGFNLGD